MNELFCGSIIQRHSTLENNGETQILSLMKWSVPLSWVVALYFPDNKDTTHADTDVQKENNVLSERDFLLHKANNDDLEVDVCGSSVSDSKESAVDAKSSAADIESDEM
eukprot:12866752-Ditylum_brightwellii.AAC.1